MKYMHTITYNIIFNVIIIIYKQLLRIMIKKCD